MSHQNNGNNLSKLRILLWDIDGTLVLSKVRGGYRHYFEATMRQIFGSCGELEKVMPSGMTDTQIMYEALKAFNFKPENILKKREELLRVFREEMLKAIQAQKEGYRILPGVEEILRATSEKKETFANALLTGNLSVAAEIKLRSVELWHYFADAPNAFGEISCDRRDLAFHAAKLFKEKYAFEFSPQQFIIIGDTPNDIATAKNFGAKVLAVATGRNQPEDLMKHQPDAVVEDLSDTDKILSILQTI